MGQKIIPASLRLNKNYTLQGSLSYFPSNLTIIKNFNYYLKKNGFVVNDLNFYKNDNIVFITLNFLVSKNSKLYTKKYRKFLVKSKRHKYQKQNIRNFLKAIANLCGVKKVYFKAKRLDHKVRRKTLLTLITNANRIGLYKYKKNKNIKDLIFSLCLLLDTGIVQSSTIAFLISKYFSWLPKRQHKRFLTFLRDLFQVVFYIDKANNNYIKGIKLQVKGRIAGKTQASIFHSIVGRIYTQSISANIDFAKDVSFSKMGTFGWKLWITKF